MDNLYFIISKETSTIDSVSGTDNTTTNRSPQRSASGFSRWVNNRPRRRCASLTSDLSDVSNHRLSFPCASCRIVLEVPGAVRTSQIFPVTCCLMPTSCSLWGGCSDIFTMEKVVTEKKGTEILKYFLFVKRYGKE